MRSMQPALHVGMIHSRIRTPYKPPREQGGDNIKRATFALFSKFDKVGEREQLGAVKLGQATSDTWSGAKRKLQSRDSNFPPLLLTSSHGQEGTVQRITPSSRPCERVRGIRLFSAVFWILVLCIKKIAAIELISNLARSRTCTANRFLSAPSAPRSSYRIPCLTIPLTWALSVQDQAYRIRPAQMIKHRKRSRITEE